MGFTPDTSRCSRHRGRRATRPRRQWGSCVSSLLLITSSSPSSPCGRCGRSCVSPHESLVDVTASAVDGWARTVDGRRDWRWTTLPGRLLTCTGADRTPDCHRTIRSREGSLSTPAAPCPPFWGGYPHIERGKSPAGGLAQSRIPLSDIDERTMTPPPDAGIAAPRQGLTRRRSARGPQPLRGADHR